MEFCKGGVISFQSSKLTISAKNPWSLKSPTYVAGTPCLAFLTFVHSNSSIFDCWIESHNSHAQPHHSCQDLDRLPQCRNYFPAAQRRSVNVVSPLDPDQASQGIVKRQDRCHVADQEPLILLTGYYEALQYNKYQARQTLTPPQYFARQVQHQPLQ